MIETVEEVWRVGGPIAAVVAIMLLSSGLAIRTLWLTLQEERKRSDDRLIELIEESHRQAQAIAVRLEQGNTAMDRMRETLVQQGGGH